MSKIEGSPEKRKSIASSVKDGYSTARRTSKRVLAKNLEKIHMPVFNVRGFVVSLLSAVSILFIVLSLVVLAQRNSITVTDVKHGDITEKIVEKHRFRKGIEYVVTYPQFYHETKNFRSLNQIVRDGVEVFVRENAWTARKDNLLTTDERIQDPYSINVGYTTTRVDEDIVSIFLRFSAHLPNDKRIEDAQSFTYDVAKEKLISLAEIVNDDQAFYTAVNESLIKDTEIVFSERYDEVERQARQASYDQKKELFFSRNSLKNLNFTVTDDGFMFYVPEEILSPDSLGYLEIPYRIQKN